MSTKGTALTRHAHLIVAAMCTLSCLACGMSKERREAIRQSDEFTLDVDGQERTYRLLVPQITPERPALLVGLHGGGGDGKQFMNHTRLGEQAIAHGFVAVFPDGLDEHWNDGRAIEGQQARDVEFLARLITQVIAQHDIDPERVYITGISNGGFMSSRMICAHSELFAGAAMVASGLSPFVAEHCPYTSPLPILMFKGTQDPLVPYNGGPVAKDRGEMVSTEEELRFWRDKNQCDGELSQSNRYDTDRRNDILVEHAIWSQGCEAHDVQLYKAVNGGHTWPGNTTQYAPKLIIGQPYDDVDATDELVAAFGLSR